ncbi:hypothetical protein WSM22_22190 [Cytophagales bacterium WSM2-2]|nr:hypothetical protein WSM22_22190 [Cytophagales bacterium WSM2-2]
MRIGLVIIFCACTSVVRAQQERRIKSIDEIDAILEVYTHILTPYVGQMVKDHLSFTEQQDKFWQWPDSLTLSRRRERKRSDSAYLSVGSIVVNRNIRALYNSDPRSFLSLTQGVVIKAIDSAYQKEFRYEGLSPEFYKEVHQKIEEKFR